MKSFLLYCLIIVAFVSGVGLLIGTMMMNTGLMFASTIGGSVGYIILWSLALIHDYLSDNM